MARTTIPIFQNLLTYSEQFDHASWTKQGGVVVTPNQAANPIDGAMTADLIDLTAASVNAGILKTVIGVNGRQNTKSIWLKGVIGTEVVNLVDPGVTAGVLTCNLTTEWQRFALTEGVGVQPTNGGIWIRKTSGDQIHAFGAQFALANWEGTYIQTVASVVNTGNIRNKPLVLQNLLTYSEQFDNVIWTKVNITVTPDAAEDSGGGTVLAPDGTATADSITATGAGAGFYQTGTGSGKGLAVTGSIWLRANESVSSGIFMNGSGLKATVSSAALITTEWQRFSVSGECKNVADTVNFGVGVGIGGYTIPNGATIHAWGAQRVHANWPGPYVQTVATAVNTGNIRNKPVVTQNLITYSEQFDNADWVKSNTTVSPNTADTLDPLGGNTADKVIDSVDGGGAWHYVGNNYNDVTAVITTKVHTNSVYAKQGTKKYLTITDATGSLVVTFDLDLGTVTYELGATGTIESDGNGWYRCSATGNSGQTRLFCYISGSSGFSAYQGDGTGAVYLWGAQAVWSNWEGPYTPTTSAVVNTGNIRNKVSSRQTL